MREFYNRDRQIPEQHRARPTHLQFNEILSKTCDIFGGRIFYIDDQSRSVALIYGVRLVVF